MAVLRIIGSGVKWAGVTVHLTAMGLLLGGLSVLLAWAVLYRLGVLGSLP